MTIFGIDLWNRCKYWVVAVDLFKYFGAGANIHRSCMVIQGRKRGGRVPLQCMLTGVIFALAETITGACLLYLGIWVWLRVSVRLYFRL